MLSENIVQIAETIKQLRKRVDERRNLWSQNTKPQIKICLEKVCKEIDLDLRVTENELLKNSSSIQLSFEIAPSGIMECNPGGGGRHFMKKPGYLNFAQSINGKIRFAVIYPFVEDLQNKPARLLLAQHEPEDINEDLITSNVLKFLEEIAKWEDNWRTPNKSMEE